MSLIEILEDCVGISFHIYEAQRLSTVFPVTASLINRHCILLLRFSQFGHMITLSASIPARKTFFEVQLPDALVMLLSENAKGRQPPTLEELIRP